MLRKLAEIRYERNDIDFSRNKFRLRGDTLEIYPAYWSGKAIRVEFFGDEVDRISEINAVTGMAERYLDHVAIYPASHYVASSEKLHRAMMDIRRECDEQGAFFRAPYRSQRSMYAELGVGVGDRTHLCARHKL